MRACVRLQATANKDKLGQKSKSIIQGTMYLPPRTNGSTCSCIYIWHACTLYIDRHLQLITSHLDPAKSCDADEEMLTFRRKIIFNYNIYSALYIELGFPSWKRKLHKYITYMHACPRLNFCDCDGYKKQMRTHEENSEAKDFRRKWVGTAFPLHDEPLLAGNFGLSY